MINNGTPYGEPDLSEVLPMPEPYRRSPELERAIGMNPAFTPTHAQGGVTPQLGPSPYDIETMQRVFLQRLQNDTQRDVAREAADAQRYGADRSANASMYGADRSANATLGAANIGADASRFNSQMQAMAHLLGIDRQGATARDVANITNQGHLDNTRAIQLGELQRNFMGGAVGLAGQSMNRGVTAEDALAEAFRAMRPFNTNPLAPVQPGQQPPGFMQPQAPPARTAPGPINQLPGMAAPPPFAPQPGAQLPPPNPALGAQLFPGAASNDPPSVRTLIQRLSAIPGAQVDRATGTIPRRPIDEVMSAFFSSHQGDLTDASVPDFIESLRTTYPGTGKGSFSDWWRGPHYQNRPGHVASTGRTAIANLINRRLASMGMGDVGYLPNAGLFSGSYPELAPNIVDILRSPPGSPPPQFYPRGVRPLPGADAGISVGGAPF